MKKLILLLVVLFSITSYSITITVMNKDNTPLKEVMVNVNNQVKVTDQNGKVTFDISSETLDIFLSKEGFQEEKLSLKTSSNSSQNLTFLMTQLKKSNIIFEFPITDGIIEYREIGTTHYTKVPFLGNKKRLTLFSGSYEFIFYTKNSKQITKILNIKDKDEFFYIDLNLNKNNFFIIGNISKDKGIKFYKDNIGSIFAPKDINLVILKEGNIIDKIKLKDTFVPISLEDGIYDFMIENKFYPNLFFRGIELNSKTNKNIVISLPSIETTINGVIKNKDQFIGGVKILFSDVENNSYEVSSNLVGEFSIKLPPQKYKITIKKPGFVLEKNQNLIYDFTVPKESYNITLDIRELLSNVEGIILDTQENPISNAKIMIKSEEKVVRLRSNEFGAFSTSALPGLIFIKVEKNGYKSFGIVTKLERFSSLSGLKISLTPYLSSISGIISDNFTPQPDLSLTLRNRKGEVIANTISNKNGYYEFSDIETNDEYFISVGVQSYQYYVSDTFSLAEEDIVNKNIILKDNQIRFYLELVNSSNNPLSNQKVSIENQLYTTDSNGFLLLELPEGTKNIDVKIESYHYKKQIKLPSKFNNPGQLTIIIP